MVANELAAIRHNKIIGSHGVTKPKWPQTRTTVSGNNDPQVPGAFGSSPSPQHVDAMSLMVWLMRNVSARLPTFL